MDGNPMLRGGIKYSLQTTTPDTLEVLRRLSDIGNRMAAGALEVLDLRPPDSAVIVTAAQQERNSGIIGATLVTTNGGNARVEGVAVAPEFQGQGVARTMKGVLIPHLIERGVGELSGRPAAGRESFYEQFGAKDDGKGEMFLRIA